MSVRLLSVLGIVSGFLLASSSALATDWTVAKTSANVRFTLDKKNWQAVTNGMQLPNNAWVDTGKRGRVSLNRGKDSINLAPGTLAGVFDLGGVLDKTVVSQQTGTVTIDVTHKWAPWMSVKTPFLAAVVKGTKFEVAISGKKVEVTVERGKVEVTDSRRGDRVDVVAGQAAVVDTSGKKSMEVTAAGQKETKTTKTTEETKSKKTETETETESKSKSNSSSSSKSNSESEGHLRKSSNSGNGNGEGNSNGNGNSGNGNGNGNGNGDSGNGNSGDHRKFGWAWKLG